MDGVEVGGSRRASLATAVRHSGRSKSALEVFTWCSEESLSSAGDASRSPTACRRPKGVVWRRRDSCPRPTQGCQQKRDKTNSRGGRSRQYLSTIPKARDLCFGQLHAMVRRRHRPVTTRSKPTPAMSEGASTSE
jgi:hypothetical protein